VLGAALNEVSCLYYESSFRDRGFLPAARGCSYRLAVVSIKKQYPGHAKRVMFGIWSALRQFMYTKFIVSR